MNPFYRSTRSAEPLVSFHEALLTGLAPDGGLYVPDRMPALDPSIWSNGGSFAGMAVQVLDRWISDEVDPDDLVEIATDAFNFSIPLVPLNGEGWDGVYVLELFHGPTLSFKDFGARTMARLMAHFLKGRGEQLTILVATSGDTGSAVADGFAGLEGIRVGLLYPKGQVSLVQERQLIVERPGVRAFAVDGTFDDCQRMVKQAFLDDGLRSVNLSSANSINIGRLLPQMLYYIWGFRQAERDEVVYCVPSGNLGNLTGAVMAYLGGLPVRRFIAGHNANDFFPRFLQDGSDHFGPSIATLSNAMDVGAPSNFERLRALLSPDEMANRIWGTSVSDAETRASMKRVYEANGYLADPHTSVGLEAARRYREQVSGDTDVIVVSTAHPAKFPETIRETLNLEPEIPTRLSDLWQRPTQVTAIAPTLEALRDELLAMNERV